MPSLGIIGGALYLIFGMAMTWLTFIFIIPGSFWALPGIITLAGYALVCYLWLYSAEKVIEHYKQNPVKAK